MILGMQLISHRDISDHGSQFLANFEVFTGRGESYTLVCSDSLTRLQSLPTLSFLKMAVTHPRSRLTTS